MSRSRRDFLKAAGLASLAGAIPSVCVAGERWNIVILSMDEHNPTFFSHLGHPDAYTPNLDALAADGTRFTRCYTTAPVCAPTRQSFITGLYPQEHGQLTNAHVFDEGNSTLPGFFQALGYHTACYGKLHTQGDEELYSYGFDVLLNKHRPDDYKALFKRHKTTGAAAYSDPDEAALWETMPFGKFKPLIKEDPARIGDYLLTQGAIEYLNEAHTKPFFLYLSLRFPHYPFDLPESHYYMYDPAAVTMPVLGPDDLLYSGMGQYSEKVRGWSSMTQDHHRILMAKYLASVSYADQLFGMVLDELEALGLRENTLVLYLSDHGDMAGVKGLWLKSTFHDGAVRKPMILRMPGVIDGGGTVDTLFSEIDILPTLAGLVGAGHLLPQISGSDRSTEVMLAANGVPRSRWARDHGVEPRDHVISVSHLSAWDQEPWATCIISEELSLIRYYSETSGERSHEAYDLVLDPGETYSVANSTAYQEQLAQLEAQLEAHLGGLSQPVFEVRKMTG